MSVASATPLAGGLQPLGKQLQLLCRRHRIPVAGPEVGAEHSDAALLQDVQRRGRHFKKGKAKERRARGSRGRSVKRRFDRRDALVDLADGCLRLHVFQIVVGPAVVRDGVALRRYRSHQFGMFRSGLADQEECRAHAFLRQRRQYLAVRRRPWPVVEGQHHLVVFQWKRLRKALEAHARGGSGVHRENA